MGEAAKAVFERIRATQHGGAPTGIPSVCSSHPLVLEAAIDRAVRNGTTLLVESTSNQVNQHGGYTGMSPGRFVAFVSELARRCGLPADRLILGGDHLGTVPFAGMPGTGAMAEAADLVAACVRAGYRKIHIDASPLCAGDATDPLGGLSESTVADRSAELIAVAEESTAGGLPPPLYVVGTEVPPPGGSRLAGETGPVTPVDRARQTVELMRSLLRARKLEGAWRRVIAIVVNPGVEFGSDFVSVYDRGLTRGLMSFIEEERLLVFEAHSTDYQPESALRDLVEDHFGILKVGPWLTFALREGMVALDAIERELARVGIVAEPSRFVEQLIATMRDNPVHWEGHYRENDADLDLKLLYSYSDRCRYYLLGPEVSAAMGRCIANLRSATIPATLLSQFLPSQYRAIAGGEIPAEPTAILRHKVCEVLDLYAAACKTDATTTGVDARE